MDDLNDLVGYLLRGKVDFVVIGGFAGLVHGSTVVTYDVDICCSFAPENLLRIQAAIAGLHPVHRMNPRHPALRLTPENAAGWKGLNLLTDMGQLDCLSHVDGVGDFEEVRRNSVERPTSHGPCRVLCLDALIRAKEAARRPKDYQALLELRAIRERLEQERSRRRPRRRQNLK